MEVAADQAQALLPSGTALITREDDCEAVIRERLRAYDRSTLPVVEWYGMSRVLRVDAAREPSEVAKSVLRGLRGERVKVFAS